MANDASIKMRVADKEKFKKDLDEGESLVKEFATGVKYALAAVAGAFVIGKIKDTVAGWISDFAGAERATAKLEAQVRSTAGAAGYTADQLATMADEIEKLTGVEAEMVQQGQSVLLLFENIRGDQFDRATMAATDLAAVLGTDVSGAARLLGKALDDPYDAVNALSKAGVDFTEQQRDMIKTMAESGDVVGAQTAILDALESKVGGTAEALGDTFGGKVTILGHRLGDLGETIAGMIVPYIEAMFPAAELAVAGLQKILDMISELIGGGEDFESTFADMFTSAFKYILTIGVDTFTYLQASYETYSMRVERLTYEHFLAIVSTYEDLKHLFTVTVPAYLEWFANNWSNIFTDLASFQATVITNMIKNISGFFEYVQGYLSGDSKNYEWTSLTEGFKATMQELPQIASRGLSDTEKMLGQNINGLTNDIDKIFEGRQKAGRDFIDGLFDAKPQAGRTKFETTESQKRRAVGKGPGETKEEEAAKTSSSSSSSSASSQQQPKEVQLSGGQIVGLEDLNKRISSAQGKAFEQSFQATQMVQAEVARKEDAKASQGSLEKIEKHLAASLTAQIAAVTAIEKLNVGLI